MLVKKKISEYWLHARCLECQGPLIPVPIWKRGKSQRANKIVVFVVFRVLEPLHHFGAKHIAHEWSKTPSGN